MRRHSAHALARHSLPDIVEELRMADFEHETAPEVYSRAREQASHLFGLPRLPGIGVPIQLAGDGGGRSSTINVVSVQPNAAIDPRFAQPAPPR
jgi:hypothetical protein